MFLEITALKDPVRKKKSELLYVTLQNLRLMNKFEKRKPLIRGGRGMMLAVLGTLYTLPTNVQEIKLDKLCA